jgi:hypothetical protein
MTAIHIATTATNNIRAFIFDVLVFRNVPGLRSICRKNHARIIPNPE